jgi:hypothetical protein
MGGEMKAFGPVAVVMALVLLLGPAGCTDMPPPVNTSENTITGDIQGTLPSGTGMITVEGIGSFDFTLSDIRTVRPDVFQAGYFSIFDILVRLDEEGTLDLAYHYDDAAETHVIDTINGISGWWYMAYYDGGWPETNAFRMDLYPYKDKMYIRILRDDPRMISRIYDAFGAEIERKRQNGGEVIVPAVIIEAPSGDRVFEDVRVTAHNLRPDIFRPGTVTGMDVILSLGDAGAITYGLQWYDSIGSAEVVRTYYVDRIDGDVSAFRCGFVYEAGEQAYSGSRGNHIHIPADTRVLESPEYVEFFWICI